MSEYEDIASTVVDRVLGSMAAGQANTPVREEVPGVLQAECVKAGAEWQRERTAKICHDYGQKFADRQAELGSRETETWTKYEAHRQAGMTLAERIKNAG